LRPFSLIPSLSNCANAKRLGIEAEQHGYLGTLYRTDFEVEGSGEFPIDMLRYTCAWPKGETDSRVVRVIETVGI